MIKVLLLAPSVLKGGIANWTNMIKNHFVSSNEVSITVISVGTNKKESYKMNVIQRIIYGMQNCFEITKVIKKYLANNRVDVIHFTSTGSLSLYRDKKIINIARKNNIPTVMHIRIGRFPEIYAKNGLEWHIFKRHFSLVNRIITIDKNTYSCVSNLFPEKTIEILNPVDLNKINGIKKENQCFNNVLSFVGWVVKAKGIEELIEAFNILKERFKALQLKIVGPFDSQYVSYLMDKYDMKGITFLGALDNGECLEVISNSELFVFPSYSEGCPNAVLEAMMCKTPIIASAVGSIPELLDNNCGLLINKQSVADIVDKASCLLNCHELQEQLSNNAFSKINNELSIEFVSKKYYKIWKELTRD